MWLCFLLSEVHSIPRQINQEESNGLAHIKPTVLINHLNTTDQNPKERTLTTQKMTIKLLSMRLGEVLPVYLEGSMNKHYTWTSKVSVPPAIVCKFCPGELSISSSSEMACTLRFQRSPNPTADPPPKRCIKGSINS